MSEILPRIVGTETEFGLVSDYSSSYDMDFDRSLPPGLVMAGHGYLSNGGRYYVDWQEQFEYATPECVSFTDVVHAEIAGEQIVYHSLKKLKPEFHLYKRLSDDYGSTWGYHENYQIPREIFGTHALNVMMLAHLATRNIFVGAGKWSPLSHDVSRVTPAQKARGVVVDINQGTTTDKPLLNTRDEALADSSKWARLHITSGDANISPWATWLKLGSTSLVLRLVETGFADTGSVGLIDPAGVARRTARDETVEETFQLENGESLTALALQDRLLAQCGRMAAHVQLPKEELQVLGAWRKAHDDLVKSVELLKDRADWVMRGLILKHYVERHDIHDVQDSRLYNVDQTWDIIHPQAGIGIKYFRNKTTFSGFDPDRANYMVVHPPTGTRASLRAKYIKNMPKIYRSDADIGWDEVTTPLASHSLQSTRMF